MSLAANSQERGVDGDGAGVANQTILGLCVISSIDLVFGPVWTSYTYALDTQKLAYFLRPFLFVVVRVFTFPELGHYGAGRILQTVIAFLIREDRSFVLGFERPSLDDFFHAHSLDQSRWPLAS